MTDDPANTNVSLEYDPEHWRQQGVDAGRKGLALNDCLLTAPETMVHYVEGGAERYLAALMAWEDGYRAGLMNDNARTEGEHN